MSQWLFGTRKISPNTVEARRVRERFLRRRLQGTLAVEVLEVRALPSVGFDLTKGLLNVAGDEPSQSPIVNDSISASVAGKFVEVDINGDIHSSDPSSINYDSALNGATTTSVKSIDIQGLTGSDTLTVNDGFFAASGHITLEGGAGNDLLTGSVSAERIFGGAATADAESLLGNDGDDTLIPDGNPGLSTKVAGHDSLDGGTGIDRVDFSGSVDSVWGKVNGKFLSSEGTAQTRNIENVIGTAFDDKITGDLNANVLIGGAGDDTIGGRGGDDTIEGNAGNDYLKSAKGNSSISGGDGNDFLSGAGGNDILDGGSGDDTILDSGQGNDSLDGGDGNDRLTGSKGNCLLVGGDGDDALFGGTGNDTLDGGSGNDSLNGGSGINTVDADQGDDVIARATQFEQVLTGQNGQTGFAEYISDTKDSADLQREFEFVLTGAAASSAYDLTIDGVVVGQITTNQNGAGQLVFASNPDSSEEAAFPVNFPNIHDGSNISVGVILQGVFVPDSISV